MKLENLFNIWNSFSTWTTPDCICFAFSSVFLATATFFVCRGLYRSYYPNLNVWTPEKIEDLIYQFHRIVDGVDMSNDYCLALVNNDLTGLLFVFHSMLEMKVEIPHSADPVLERVAANISFCFNDICINEKIEDQIHFEKLEASNKELSLLLYSDDFEKYYEKYYDPYRTL